MSCSMGHVIIQSTYLSTFTVTSRHLQRAGRALHDASPKSSRENRRAYRRAHRTGSRTTAYMSPVYPS